MQQVAPASRGANSSRQAAAAAAAAAQGAWAPWRCAPAGQAGVQQQEGRQQVHVDPRRMVLSQPLRLQLGQTITLHFVATDFMGCLTELSKQQRTALVGGGLQLVPCDGEQLDSSPPV